MDENPGLPPDLRFLKTLVTILTGVMIVGLITVVGLLVTRLPDANVLAGPDLPASLALPDGADVFAVTEAPGRWLVTTTDDRLFIFDGEGALLREIPLD